jgi:hypothetical protein
MLKTGWLRLWIVAMCSILVAALTASAIYVWGTPIAYRFVTVSISDQASPEDRKLAESMKQEAITKTFQGKIEYSPVLTLEDLAKRGVVTQVSFQWLEPSGWSGDEHDQIDIVWNREEIKTSEIIRRASRNIHRARVRRAATYVSPVLPVCVAALLLGVGVAWIRKGVAAS